MTRSCVVCDNACREPRQSAKRPHRDVTSQEEEGVVAAVVVMMVLCVTEGELTWDGGDVVVVVVAVVLMGEFTWRCS